MARTANKNNIKSCFILAYFTGKIKRYLFLLLPVSWAFCEPPKTQKPSIFKNWWPLARCWWLMSVIEQLWRQRSGGLRFKASPGK
jgi:hypothetical protein